MSQLAVLCWVALFMAAPLQFCLAAESRGRDSDLDSCEDSHFVQLRARLAQPSGDDDASSAPSRLGSEGGFWPKVMLKILDLYHIDFPTDLESPTFLEFQRANRSNRLAEWIQWNESLGLPFGNISYTQQSPEMLLPDVDAVTKTPPRPLKPWNGTEFVVWVKDYQIGLINRIVLFDATLHQLPDNTSAYAFLKASQDAAEAAIIANSTGADPLKGLHFVQGSGDIWDTDKFAAEFIGRTYMAALLDSAHGEDAATGAQLVLDLSGDAVPGSSRLQILKQRAARLAPEGLLRTRGFFMSAAKAPTLTQVDVFDPEAQQWLSFTPCTSSKEEWSLAKSALVSLALFVEECFHTGMHLYSGNVMAAVQNSVLATSQLYGMMTPRALMVGFALLEQASILHTNHGSSFSGEIWDCNITAVWHLTVDIAHFLFDVDPLQIVGADAATPAWWAGMSAAFLPAIEEFSAEVADALVLEAGELRGLASELERVGSYKLPPVTNRKVLGKLFRNLLFVQGVCHTHMYSTREAMTALAGWPTTIGMLPYLKGQSVDFDTETTSELRGMTSLAFGTASGFEDTVPQLEDGPWPGADANSGLSDAIGSFKESIEKARVQVWEFFGEEQNGGYLPSYFYPKNVTKPFGFSITQTTYV